MPANSQLERTQIDIVQDHEYDECFDEVGSRLPVFWAKGHGFDARDFIRAVLNYCPATGGV